MPHHLKMAQSESWAYLKTFFFLSETKLSQAFLLFHAPCNFTCVFLLCMLVPKSAHYYRPGALPWSLHSPIPYSTLCSPYLMDLKYWMSNILHQKLQQCLSFVLSSQQNSRIGQTENVWQAQGYLGRFCGRLGIWTSVSLILVWYINHYTTQEKEPPSQPGPSPKRERTEEEAVCLTVPLTPKGRVEGRRRTQPVEPIDQVLLSLAQVNLGQARQCFSCLTWRLPTPGLGNLGYLKEKSERVGSGGGP